MADIVASSKRFKKKIPDKWISQERFAFDVMRIERGPGIYEESGQDWDRRKESKGLSAWLIALGGQSNLLGMIIFTDLTISA